MSRFTDDFPFFGAPRKGPPATLNILLAELHVSFESVAKQRAAIDRWLETNKPSPRLASELEKRHLTSRV